MPSPLDLVWTQKQARSIIFRSCPLLRSVLIYLSKALWARRIVTGWRFARRAASRFIAGDTLTEAIQVIRQLNELGLYATFDHLGENVTNLEEAEQSKEAYLFLLREIERENVKTCISVKLTQLGLAIDWDLCREYIEDIVRLGAELGNFIRIDMEDSPVIDQTLRIYQALRESGHTNVGMVIQSYLYRSKEDTRALLSQGIPIRLVKGAYKEPPEIAFPKKKDVDQNFDNLTKIVMDEALSRGAKPAAPNGKLPPLTAIATHDEKRIAFARNYAETIGFPREALEFQMLHGIRTNLQISLVNQGYPVRVYVPYGTEWYPYFMRRLAERPANLWFFLSNLLRR
jgi:proline dehydrogenase